MNKKHIGLSLSGGGHRATIFALGALLYLVDSGRNQDVRLITSVSGGSITNSWLSLFPTSFNQWQCNNKEEFEDHVAQFSKQIAGRPWCWWFTIIAYFLSYLIWIAPEYLESLTWSWSHRAQLFWGCFIVLAFGIGPRSRGTLWGSGVWWAYVGLVVFGLLAGLVGLACSHPGWGFGIIAVALLLWYVLAPLMAAHAFGRTISISSDNSGLKVDTSGPLQDKKNPGPSSSKTRHIYCATQVQAKRHFYMSREFVYSHHCGLGTSSPLRLCDAVQASANFPFAFPPRFLDWKDFGFSTHYQPHKVSRILLIDGGVYDNTGFSWYDEFHETKRRVEFQTRLSKLLQNQLKELSTTMEDFEQIHAQVQGSGSFSKVRAKEISQAFQRYLEKQHGYIEDLDNMGLSSEFKYLEEASNNLKNELQKVEKNEAELQSGGYESLYKPALHLLSRWLKLMESLQKTGQEITLQKHHLIAAKIIKENLGKIDEVIVINSAPVGFWTQESPWQILRQIKTYFQTAAIMYDTSNYEYLSKISGAFLLQSPFKGGIASIDETPVELAQHIIGTYHRLSDPRALSLEEDSIPKIKGDLHDYEKERRFPIKEPSKSQYLRAVAAYGYGLQDFAKNIQVSKEEYDKVDELQKKLTDFKKKAGPKLVALQDKLEAVDRLAEIDSEISRITIKLEDLTVDLEYFIGSIKSRRLQATLAALRNTLPLWVWSKFSWKVATTLRPIGEVKTARLLQHGYCSTMLNLHCLSEDYPLLKNGIDFRSFEKLAKGEQRSETPVPL